MGRFVVWIEGVDFFDTLFDTQKLSVIRGASRALEEMAGVARAWLKPLNPRHITAGASQAVFVVDGQRAAVQTALDDLMGHLSKHGLDPATAAAVNHSSQPDLADCTPFAHLKFHVAFEEVTAGNFEAAYHAARGAVRTAQMRDPGVRRVLDAMPLPSGRTGPCEFDLVRPAQVEIDAPDPDNKKDSVKRYVSKASAARWHFGRALRQRLYQAARAGRSDAETAFCDDFQETIAAPRPLSRGLELPVSARRKIAVFSADGDGFGGLRTDLIAALGAEAGLACMTIALRRMNGLLTGIARDLFAMSADADENLAMAAAAILGEGDDRASATKAQRDLGVTRLHRFETLLFGGEDIVFVVPCWLAWWLALRFFEETAGWEVTLTDVDEAIDLCPDYVPNSFDPATFVPARFKMRFSAGLVICSCKTPIRAAKKLAEDLCHLAKRSGNGLEIEVLESVEPPFDGIEGLRDRLLGTDWRYKDAEDENKLKSRLVIGRDEVSAVYKSLHDLWCADPPFPASQAYNALRAEREASAARAPDQRGIAHGGADAKAALEHYFKRAGSGGGYKIVDLAALKQPALQERWGLHLHFALQQRDYILAAGKWTDAVAGIVATAATP